jgi:hypothetical protein
VLLWGLSQAAGAAAGQKVRRAARETGANPGTQKVAAALAHTIVGLSLAPLDATGVLSPVTALLHARPTGTTAGEHVAG